MKILTFIANNLTKGIILVSIVHIINDIINIQLPLNPFTVTVASTLGIPGVITMLFLSKYIS